MITNTDKNGNNHRPAAPWLRGTNIPVSYNTACRIAREYQARGYETAVRVGGRHEGCMVFVRERAAARAEAA